MFTRLRPALPARRASAPSVSGAASAGTGGTEDPDAAALRAAAGGDVGALEALYRRHAAAVYRYAWLLTGSEAAAADVVQDTFVGLIEHAARSERRLGFDPARGSCAAYLCGIARHRALRLRDLRLQVVDDLDALPESAVGDDAPGLPPMPADAAERAQALQHLYAAIGRLPPHYRDVLVLVELQELSYADVAAITGIELGTVRSRLSRARARLVELLAGQSAIAVEGTRVP